MLTQELWRADLPYVLDTPVYDPLTDSLLISDGWGTPLGALSLRRVSLSDGALEARLVVRGGVYSIALGTAGDTALAAVGNRLVEFDRRTLQERRRWDSRVPRYSQLSAFVGRNALLMNWARPTLTLYDLEGGASKRWALGGCNGMYVRPDERVIVCSGHGLVSVCDVTERSLVSKPESPFALSAYAPDVDLLVLGLGRPADMTQGRERLLSRVLLIGPTTRNEIETPCAFETLWVSRDGNHLYLGAENSLSVCQLHDNSCELIAALDFPENHMPRIVVPERGLVVGSDRGLQSKRVSAWSL